MSSPLWKSLPALAAVVLFATSPVAAQVCGDADGSGSVTVTDGVQVLRAAAGLSSSCTTATCDVDGSGSITVTDGVNVLRSAAGLSVTLNCPSGGVDTQQVKSLLNSALPIFGGLTKIGSSASASARAADTQTFSCDNFDGSETVTNNPNEIDIVFQNCDSGDLSADGSITLTPNGLGFNVGFTDLGTGQSEFLNGTLTQETDRQTIFTSGSFTLADSEFGSFGIAFDQLVLDPNTSLFVGGALAFTAESGQLGAINRIVAFDPSNVAFVEVDLADGESLPFNYDLQTGALTPISN